MLICSLPPWILIYIYTNPPLGGVEGINPGPMNSIYLHIPVVNQTQRWGVHNGTSSCVYNLVAGAHNRLSSKTLSDLLYIVTITEKL